MVLTTANYQHEFHPRIVFLIYWHEANISEVKIPYKLHSHNGLNLLQNRHSYSKNSKQW